MAKKTTPPSRRGSISSTRGLTQLGSARRNKPARTIETFPFRDRGRETVVTFHCSEFTCLCPLTGQPDFAELEITYIPAGRAIESKSLKNYLWGFRDTGMFHEDGVNLILDELFAMVSPKWMRVIGRFKVRGGIAIDVESERFAEVSGR